MFLAATVTQHLVIDFQLLLLVAEVKEEVILANASVNGRENVVALCDIDPNGNHGVIDSRKKFPKAKFYTDFKELHK